MEHLGLIHHHTGHPVTKNEQPKISQGNIHVSVFHYYYSVSDDQLVSLWEVRLN